MVIPFLKVKVRNTIPLLFRNGNRTANGVPLFLRTVTIGISFIKRTARNAIPFCEKNGKSTAKAH